MRTTYLESYTSNPGMSTIHTGTSAIKPGIIETHQGTDVAKCQWSVEVTTDIYSELPSD